MANVRVFRAVLVSSILMLVSASAWGGPPVGDDAAIGRWVAALKADSWRVRMDAAKAMGKVNDPRMIGPLVAALSDKNWRVRLAAAEALAGKPAPGAVKPLLSLLKDEVPSVRVAAVKALAGREGKPVTDALLAALGNDYWEVRSEAVKALARRNDPRIIPALSGMLADDDSQTRAAALKGLVAGRVRLDFRAVKPLLAILADEDARTEAAHGVRRVLWRIRGRRALGAFVAAMGPKDRHRVQFHVRGNIVRLAAGKAPAELIDMLKHEDAAVRSEVALLLAKFKDSRTVEPLLAVFRNDTEINVRRQAAMALGMIGDRGAVEPLIGMLSGKKAHDRRTVVSLLGRLGDKRAAKPLIGLLSDKAENLDIRRLAAQSLGHVGDVRAVGVLIAAMPEKHQPLWRAATFSLSQIGTPEAVRALIGALTGGNSDRRQAAAAALGNASDKQAVLSLVAVLKKKDAFVGHIAAAALGRLKAAEGVESLIEALKAKDRCMAFSAARALGRIGDRRAVEPLMVACGHDHASVRRAAVEALAAIGDPRAAPVLRKFVDTGGDRYLCYPAAAALGEMADAGAVDVLIQTLDDSDARLAGNAARALRKIGGKRAEQAAAVAIRRWSATIADEGEKLQQKVYATRKLGWSQGPLALAALAEALKNKDRNVRSSAAGALGRFTDPAVIAPLISVMDDPWLPVEHSAILALRRLTGEKFYMDADLWLDWWKQRRAGPSSRAKLESLIKALGSEDFQTRERAEADIKAIGPAALPQLRKHVDSKDAETAERVEKIIEHFAQRDAWKKLRLVLSVEKKRHVVAAAGRVKFSLTLTNTSDRPLLLPVARGLFWIDAGSYTLVGPDGREIKGVRAAVKKPASPVRILLRPKETVTLTIRPFLSYRRARMPGPIGQPPPPKTPDAAKRKGKPFYLSLGNADYFTLTKAGTYRLKFHIQGNAAPFAGDVSRIKPSRRGCGLSTTHGMSPPANTLYFAGKVESNAVAFEIVRSVSEKEKLERLIRKLGGKDFNVRKQAEAAIKAIGPAAVQYLRKHLDNSDPEIASSVERIIGRYEGEPVGGLKLSVLPVSSRTGMRQAGPFMEAAPVDLKLTFTNVSDKPITLSCYRFNRLVSFESVIGPDGHVQVGRVKPARIEPPKPTAADFPVIKPGGSVTRTVGFPGRSGITGAYRFRKAGKYGFTVAYKITQRDIEGVPAAAEAWAGTVTSNPVVLEVQPAKPANP